MAQSLTKVIMLKSTGTFQKGNEYSIYPALAKGFERMGVAEIQGGEAPKPKKVVESDKKKEKKTIEKKKKK